MNKKDYKGLNTIFLYEGDMSMTEIQNQIQIAKDLGATGFEIYCKWDHYGYEVECIALKPFKYREETEEESRERERLEDNRKELKRQEDYRTYLRLKEIFEPKFIMD